MGYVRAERLSRTGDRTLALAAGRRGARFADYVAINADLVNQGFDGGAPWPDGDRFGRAAAFLVAAAPVTLRRSPVRGGQRAGKATTVTALPIWLTGPLFVIVLPALAIGAQLMIRRSWPALADGGHNDVAGFIIAVVGVLYAVLLAFVMIVSWESFSQAESTVGQEASALRSIYPRVSQFSWRRAGPCGAGTRR
jgi:hypothetical protein